MAGEVGDDGGAVGGGDLSAHLHHIVHGAGPAGSILGIVAEGVNAVAGAAMLKDEIADAGIGLGGGGSGGGGGEGGGVLAGDRAQTGAADDEDQRQADRESQKQNWKAH